MTSRDRTLAAIATTRFGLGARPGEIADVASDPRDWLVEQARAPRGEAPPELRDLASAQEILADYLAARRQRAATREAATSATSTREPPAQFVAGVRETLLPHYQAQVAARTRLAVASGRSFHERLVQFWSNHFAVSVDKPIVLGLAGAMENEAIRPHVTGRFVDMLEAVESHPAMITYLDNERSVGPHSELATRLARRPAYAGTAGRQPGINENLAREILELHTLGVDAGYTQRDVTAFATVLTGWSIGGGRFPQGEPGSFQFRAAMHEPGTQTLLARRYAERGFAQGRAVLEDLAHHPATARHLSTKLARHFVADTPPPALVDRLARAYLKADGDLSRVYESLVTWDGAWEAAPAKFKTPRDFIYSSLRAFDVAPDSPRDTLAAFALLGQPHFKPGSPAGWPDRAPDWDGADALMKRIEWSAAFAARLGDSRSAAEAAAQALGPLVSEHTRTALARAASGSQALTLLLMSPEFQRR